LSTFNKDDDDDDDVRPAETYRSLVYGVKSDCFWTSRLRKIFHQNFHCSGKDSC